MVTELIPIGISRFFVLNRSHSINSIKSLSQLSFVFLMSSVYYCCLIVYLKIIYIYINLNIV
jgi:hypothetical protein